jgi:hypothetical protein
VRINNHQHTDLQEYLGSWVPDEQGERGVCVWREAGNKKLGVQGGSEWKLGGGGEYCKGKVRGVCRKVRRLGHCMLDVMSMGR